MDLFVTWEGHTGDGIKYDVDYRPYPAGGSWISAAVDITTTYTTIIGLVTGFYEIRVRTDCASSDTDYIYKIEGRAPCPTISFVRYEIINDNPDYQTVKVFYTGNTSTIRVVATNLNNGAIIFNQLLISEGYDNVNIDMPKIAGQTTVYNISISNICEGLTQPAVSMGDYSVVGPPAVITTSFKLIQNFKGPTNCSPPSTSNKPSTGTRATFSEPLPQAVTIVFDHCATYVTGGQGHICDSQTAFNPVYRSVTIPAGTVTWAAGHYRTSDVYPNTETTCIIRVIPEILNNGKKLSFTDAPMCTTFNPNIPIFDENPFISHPCINGVVV